MSNNRLADHSGAGRGKQRAVMNSKVKRSKATQRKPGERAHNTATRRTSHQDKPFRVTTVKDL